MNIIKNLTFEKLVLMSIIVFLASITTAENKKDLRILAFFTQVVILIWLALKK
ncbi:hypothetical protein [Fusobacterium varium]